MITSQIRFSSCQNNTFAFEKNLFKQLQRFDQAEVFEIAGQQAAVPFDRRCGDEAVRDVKRMAFGIHFYQRYGFGGNLFVDVKDRKKRYGLFQFHNFGLVNGPVVKFHRRNRRDCKCIVLCIACSLYIKVIHHDFDVVKRFQTSSSLTCHDRPCVIISSINGSGSNCSMFQTP